DIFDTKKQLVLKYMKQAVELYSKCDNEDDVQYKEQMSTLLQSMRSQEHDVQQRRTQENNTNSMYSYFSKTFYKASEKLMGKGQLGQIVDFLIKEFNERSTTKGLVYN
ncbi:MAG: hypothetical protein HYX60_04660, partial [Legionella longbeachae]|nr:hypothetical protein [Legionella longbeachae]